MMAAGQNPFILAMRQGTQVSQMMNQMGGRTQIPRGLASGFVSMINPVSLVTIGVIAAGAAIVQWMSSGSDAVKDFTSAIGDADSAISNLRFAVDTMNGATLNTSLESRLQGLQAEAIAMRLVNTEAFRTEEGAQALAEAILATGGAVDAQTASMIQQIDAAAALNEQLNRNAEKMP